MVMNNYENFLTELLDEILQHLKPRDLYSCLLVNRQFHAHAIAFLYRDLRFYCLSYNKRWTQLYNKPKLASHIRTLHFDLTGIQIGQDKLEQNLPPFDQRVEFLLRHGRRIRHIDLHTKMSGVSRQLLD